MSGVRESMMSHNKSNEDDVGPCQLTYSSVILSITDAKDISREPLGMLRYSDVCRKMSAKWAQDTIYNSASWVQIWLSNTAI